MNRFKRMWARHGGFVLLTLPVAAIAAYCAIRAAVADSTPRTAAEPPAEREITFDMERNRAYTAADGVVVIPASDPTPPDAELLTTEPSQTEPSQMEPPAAAISNRREAAPSLSTVNSQLSTNYTLPEDVMMEDGSIGLLTIPKLALSVSVFETADEMEAMSRGVAHFKTTSSWSGNIGLCSHNVNFDLTDGYFKHIHTLVPGDTVSYQTALGVKTYAVETVAEIAETDWGYLGRTEDDRITLITCISGKPRSRIVVQGLRAD